MTHELSHDPIKVHIVDLKKGEFKKNIIFVGRVPDQVKKELNSVEKAYNSGKKIYNSNILKKFYGINWKKKLGLDSDGNKIGGNETPNADNESSNDNFSDESNLVDMIPIDDCEGGNEVENQGGNEVENQGGNEVENQGGNEVENQGGNEEAGSELEIPDLDLGVDISIDTQMNDMDNNIMITDEDINDLNPDNEKKIENIFVEKEGNIKIEKSGNIQFIYEIQLFPGNNMLNFKYKLYLILNIPIYRQHLWFNYKKKSFPVSYDIIINKNVEHVDIEKLISFYSNNDSKIESIENIPINMNYYKNKDFIQIISKETTNLLLTNFKTYGVTDYYLVDLDDLIGDLNIYNKFREDKYKLDLIYNGFIIIYFPMITYPVFMDYIKNEKNISHIYSFLAPSKNELRRKYDMESILLSESYDSFSINDVKIQKKLFSSIRETTININNYKQEFDSFFILRNLFDILELNDIIVYCKTYLTYENKKVILKKSYLNEKEPKDIIPINSLLIKIKTNADTNENMKLMIFKNGNYLIKTEWREENHMNFAKIIQVVSKKINPIIKIINNMSSKIKYYNVNIPEITSENVSFTETSIIFYYDDDLTEERFSLLKKLLHDFRISGIIENKSNTTIGNEFFYNYGIYNLDVTRLDKTITTNNYYEYLSNGIVAQKWTTLFDNTKLLQILNVSSKLKISINGLRNETEMNFFYIFLIGLIHLYNKNSAKMKKITNETIGIKMKKMLKNLKLQDPKLYDFNKIYKSNIIYSKICQKPYQPLLLNDNEYENLPKEQKKNAIKYWNFTKEKPAWYSCPNPKYPYIKFIIKQHPRDFCIPCCKKIMMNENVNIKKQEIHNTCLKKYKYEGEKINLTKDSHYIATYGKNIEVGRLSRLPEHTLEPLFFDVYSPDGIIDQECITADGYYLLGVDQHLPSIENVGLIYCIMHSLNKGLVDFLEDCVTRIKKNPDNFRVLLDGNINTYFADYKELIDIIINLGNDTILPNKYETLSWNNLFVSIGYYYYGINTILFRDQYKEMIELVLPKNLKNVDEMLSNNHKNLIILQKKEKYYPIYLINTEIYKRTGIIDTRLFLNESGIMAIIKSVIRKSLESTEIEKIKYQIDLTIIKKFVHANKLSISGYFINYSNSCYAVMIKFHSSNCYLPIFPSYYSMEKDVNVIMDPYSEKYETNYEVLNKLYEAYNKWVVNISEKEGFGSVNIYPLIKNEGWLNIKDTNNIVGFVCNNVYYYCKKITLERAKILSDAKIVTILYDPAMINNLIFSFKSGKTLFQNNKKLDDKLNKSLYNYHLYDLVVMHFSYIFNSQRNDKLRKKLLLILSKTNFSKNTDDLQTFISEIEDNEDVIKLKNIIAKYLSSHNDKKKIIDDIKTSYFNFDKVELEKLKKMTKPQVKKSLSQIASKFVIFADIEKEKNFTFPNMITTCTSSDSKEDISYCKDKKLIIKKDQLDDILEILSDDIINPMKWQWLFNNIFISMTSNFFKFIRRPNENITIEFL